MRKPRPKKQHYVPELHLKHFVGTNPPNMVWTYDKQGGEPRPSLPKETGAQGNFYSVREDDGSYNDTIEHWLATTEDKATPVYDQLLKGEIPVGQVRADFSDFLAFLYVRTPAQLRMTAEMYGECIQTMATAVASDPQRLMKHNNNIPGARSIDFEKAKDMSAWISDPDNYVIQVDRKAGLPILLAAEKLRPVMFSMGWIVIGSDEPTFITSDHPVERSTPSSAHHPLFGRRICAQKNRSELPAVPEPMSCPFLGR